MSRPMRFDEWWSRARESLLGQPLTISLRELEQVMRKEFERYKDKEVDFGLGMAIAEVLNFLNDRPSDQKILNKILNDSLTEYRKELAAPTDSQELVFKSRQVGPIDFGPPELYKGKNR